MKISSIIILIVNILKVDSLLCSVCWQTVNILADVTQFMVPSWVAIEVLTAICMKRYDSQKLCQRVGEEIAPLAISNFINNHISPWKACSLFCQNTQHKYNVNQEVDRILNANSESHNLTLNLSSSYIHTIKHQIPQKSVLNVMQISDIHLDINYAVHSSIYCEYPICCHSEDGYPDNSRAQAQYYGSKNCDSPPQLFQSFLNFAKKEQAVDIILLTGDISAHNQWEKTPKSILETEKQVENKIQEHFPSSIVIKSQGNNDYVPDHQYRATQSSKLVTVTNIEVGQDLITFVSPNTIAYDELNLYILGDQTYSIFQLKLLEQVLQQYNHIYLIGHIPPTFGGAIEGYSIVFRALVSKYREKIKGQFYGHTHSDQLTVHTDPRSGKAQSYGFVCPSLSPLFIGSSRARIYQIEGTKGVHDYKQFILRNLDTANGQAWELEYKMKQKYEISHTIITCQDVEGIKQKVFGDKMARRKYIRTTGLNQQLASKSHCNLLDDYTARRTCVDRKGMGFVTTERLAWALGLAMGDWSYNQLLVR